MVVGWMLGVLVGLAFVSLGVMFFAWKVRRSLDANGWDVSHPADRSAKEATEVGDIIAKVISAFVLVALALAVLFYIATVAKAETDELGPWFRSLKIPGTDISCCSELDCARVKHRTTPKGYEVEINGAWLPVPPEAVLQHMTNPTGSAVACYMPHRGVMCFVRPAEA